MLGWFIISIVTIVGTGTFAYFYYNLLNYFVRKNIESYPFSTPIEKEPAVQRITIGVGDDLNSDEGRILFKKINKIDMKIHRA